MTDDTGADEPPITVSRRTALAALGGALTLGTAGVYAASLSGDSGGDEFAAGYRRADGESAHLGVNYAGSPILGRLDADLRLFYWSDYQCPYCEQFEANTLPKLAENHVATGDLAIVFLELPVFGADSTTAAHASKCVWKVVHDADPDAWGRWHRHVFAQQGQKNSGWATESKLYEYTAAVDGVDEAKVRQCMDERRTAVTAATQEDVDTALDELELRRATPAFAMSNPEAGAWLDIPGAQPYETFEKVIDRLQDA